ncbi:DoxX family protein [Streptomyces sp. NPDC002992]|uniref:DoxX family protein n=1 Tax=Streptomyces sp. NPDC002992 TaxID=3154273 RepID=UPI0033BFA734
MSGRMRGTNGTHETNGEHGAYGTVGGGPGGPGGSGGPGGPGGPTGWRATASRYALLPLRVFLGVTFIYAGLDKLTDSSFMADTGSGSIGEMMRGVRDSSAVPALVDLALKNPTGFGHAIAIGELAVGIGTLLGLYARLAALGGALISLSLWLTVSWQSDPYYYGNDLAYLMSWLPLVLAGAPMFSLDAVLAERRRRR